MQILLRNAKQILGVVTATFPSFEDTGPTENCDALPNDIDELACQWRNLQASLQGNGSTRDGWTRQTSEVRLRYMHFGNRAANQ